MALDEHHKRLRPDLFKVLDGPARDDEKIRSLVSGADTQAIFVAEDQSTSDLVGFVHVLEKRWPESALTPATRSADIDALFLKDAFRRRGIAKSLVDASEKWAKERHLGQLTLSVRAFNREAVAAYEAMRFEHLVHRMARPIPDEPSTQHMSTSNE